MNLQLTVVAIVIVTIDIAVVDAVVGIRVGSVTDIVAASLCIGVIRQCRLPGLLQGTSLSQRVVGGRTLRMSQSGKPYHHWMLYHPSILFPEGFALFRPEHLQERVRYVLSMMTSSRDSCRESLTSTHPVSSWWWLCPLSTALPPIASVSSWSVSSRSSPRSVNVWMQDLKMGIISRLVRWSLLA